MLILHFFFDLPKERTFPPYTPKGIHYDFFIKAKIDLISVQKNISLSLNKGMIFCGKHVWLKKSLCVYCSGSQIDVFQSKSLLSQSEFPSRVITLAHCLQMEFREIKVSKISKPFWIFPEALFTMLSHDFNAIYLSFSLAP